MMVCLYQSLLFGFVIEVQRENIVHIGAGGAGDDEALHRLESVAGVVVPPHDLQRDALFCQRLLPLFLAF